MRIRAPIVGFEWTHSTVPNHAAGKDLDGRSARAQFFLNPFPLHFAEQCWLGWIIARRLGLGEPTRVEQKNFDGARAKRCEQAIDALPRVFERSVFEKGTAALFAAGEPTIGVVATEIVVVPGGDCRNHRRQRLERINARESAMARTLRGKLSAVDVRSVAEQNERIGRLPRDLTPDQRR